MKKIFLTTFLVALCVLHSNAQVLWQEDFEGEPNNATTGTAGGTLGGSWNASNPGGTFSRQNLFRNSFMVDGTSSEGVWSTNVINITSVGYAVIDIAIGSVGFGFDNGDYVRAYYILDNNGVEVLFAESFGSLLSDVVNGSAIVSGASVQVVVRANDNSFFGVVDFDDVSITAAPVLYSRKSGTWTDVTGGFNGSGTWSTQRSGNPACGCVPLNDIVAVIQNGHTVTIPTSQTAIGGSGTPNLAPGAVDVEGGGILRYNVNGVTLGIQDGLFRVRNGGVVNSSAAGITGETISFNANVGGAALQVDGGGSLTIENLTLGTNATNLHYLSGSGTVNIQNDIIINADNGRLTNNLSSNLTVTDRIEFATGVTNASFVNNGALNAATVFFDATGDTFTNTGTLTIQNILVNANTDDNNTFNNSGTLDLNSTANSIDANAANFFINNTGTIIQAGNFANLVNGSNFINAATGIWEWALNGNVIPANFAGAMDCSAAGNTFNYSGTGNQNIAPIPYHHLILSNGGSKTPSANLDVNGNLNIQTSTTLAAGAFLVDVEGNITMSGTSVFGGTGNITIGGSWSANNAASFTEGTRTVTFDGSGTETITNSSGNETFYSLTINKGAAANTVTMQNDITVLQTLTLTRGRLQLDGNALNVSRNNAGAITGGSANSFIVSETTGSPYGRIIWSTGATNATFTFPFGTTGGSYIPYVLGKTVGTAAAGTVSVATYPTGANNTPYPASVTHTDNGTGVDRSALVVNRFWMVNTTGYATLTATQSLMFTAAEASGVGTPRTAQRWNGTNAWNTGVGSSNANPYPVTSSNLQTSSIWVVASTTAALPVSWLAFTAELDNDEVVLSWETAMELNNDHFIVERAQDIEHFEEIDRIRSQGDSRIIQKYVARDPNPLSGTTYYRIKQVDFDGTITHSKLQKVHFSGPEFGVLHAYPNPGTGKSITIEIKGVNTSNRINIDFYNAQGMLVLTRTLIVKTPGYLKEDLEFSDPLPPGLYIVKAGQSDFLTRKIVIK